MIKLAEGKTKIIEVEDKDSTIVTITSKDDLTAGDGARRLELPGKGAASNETTSSVFQLLNREGVPTHYLHWESLKRFSARRARQIPIEVVIRGQAEGSYLQRHPEVSKGIEFDEPVVEFYLKDDARHDPLMVWDTERRVWLLFDAHQPVSNGPIGELTDVLENVPTDPAAIEKMIAVARKVFIILRKAWAKKGCRLKDLKIEFGYDWEIGGLKVTDVIDNDSWRVESEKEELSKQRFRDMTWPLSEEDKTVILQLYRRVAKLARDFPVIDLD